VSQSLEGIDNVVDLGRANVELQRLVRLECHGILLTRHAKLGTQVAAENLGDWRRHVFLTGSPGDGRLLLRTNFEPAVGILGLPIGLVRLRFVVGLVLNNANTFVVKTFQEEAKELFGILLVSASHTLETGESADRIVDVLWRNRLAILLKLLLTECFLDLL